MNRIPEMPVNRTREWNLREYGEDKFPGVVGFVQEAIDRGAELPAALAHVVRREVIRERGAFEEVDAIFGGRPTEVPISVAIGGYQALINEAVLACCEPDTNLVVELGSGWGRNLFAIWCAGGPREATYVAAEFTDAGREASERLGTLAPAMSLRTLPFDYTRPELGDLPDARHAVVITGHSVDMMPELGPGVFAAIRGVAERVSCLHFEAVGWQSPDRGDREGSSEEYATHNDYNRNLIAAVRAEEAEERIVVDRIIPEVVGINPRHSTTLIAWRSA